MKQITYWVSCPDYLNPKADGVLNFREEDISHYLVIRHSKVYAILHLKYTNQPFWVELKELENIIKGKEDGTPQGIKEQKDLRINDNSGPVYNPCRTRDVIGLLYGI